jgi:hypothetical protein
MMRLFGFLALLSSASICLIGADYAKAGALSKGDAWEISVIYSNTVQRAISQDNYILPAGVELTDIRDYALDNAVVLVATGLATNSAYSITLTNVQGTNGATLPALPLSFTASGMSWAAIGVQELGFQAQAMAGGNNSFDLIGGGSEMFNQYDESTFVYELITGDFDKRVRIEFQEGSSQDARAGLMVREVLDELKPRPIDPSDPAEAFSRYLQIHVNPVTTAFTDFQGKPVPGSNRYQINFRSLPGGATDSPPTDTNAPAYPNAWVRLKRVGQTFHVFRGSDGTNWVRQGTFTFPTTDLDGNAVPAISNTLYVGPNYSPEVSNIPLSTGDRRAFLALFRDYSNASGDVDIEPPQISIKQNGSQVEVSWTAGTLEGTTNITSATWTSVGTVSPLKVTPDKRYQFYRARNP